MNDRRGRGVAVLAALVAGVLVGFLAGTQSDLGREAASLADLVGTWEGGAVRADGSVQNVLRFSFRPDGTGAMIEKGREDDIRYAVDGDKIAVDVIRDSAQWGFSLAGDMLTIALGDVKVRLHRVREE